MCLLFAKNDAEKIQELVRQKRALKNIICDIYGRNYRGMTELELVDSTKISESSWRAWKVSEIIYVQTFMNGFPKSEFPFLSKASLKVHEQVPKYGECITTILLNLNTSGKKMGRSYNKRIVVDVISTLKKLVDRQKDNEVRAIYGLSLSAQYANFQMKSVKWHSPDAEK